MTSGMIQDVDSAVILVSRRRRPGARWGDLWPWCACPISVTRAGQIKGRAAGCHRRDIVHKGDRIVCLTGSTARATIRPDLVLAIGTESEMFSASAADRSRPT